MGRDFARAVPERADAVTAVSGPKHRDRCRIGENRGIALVKTVIAPPADLFARADDEGLRKGISRSRLSAKALGEHLDPRRAAAIMAKLNEVLPEDPEGLDRAFAAAQSEAVTREDW